MTFSQICEHFDAKLTGSGKAQARCLAHRDHTPSLSICEGRDGRVVLFCHAGCKTQTILQAAGLRFSDLFPHGAPLTPAERERQARVNAARNAENDRRATVMCIVAEIERLTAKCADRLLELLVRSPSGEDANELARCWHWCEGISRDAAARWSRLDAGWASEERKEKARH